MMAANFVVIHWGGLYCVSNSRKKAQKAQKKMQEANDRSRLIENLLRPEMIDLFPFVLFVPFCGYKFLWTSLN